MRRFLFLSACACLAALAQPPAAPQTAAWQQAYLYAYPLVLMDVTREASTMQQGMNALLHSRAFPTDRFRTIVRPNADTLYTSAWLDLGKEPVLIRLPDTHERYYLLQVLDAWTETIAVPGKRTTGTGEGWFAIVGPGWKGKLPAPVKQRIDCPTNLAWVLGRIQTNGAADYANVHAIQDGFRMMTLSQYPDGSTRRPAKPASPSEAARKLTPPEIVQAMSAAEFFDRFQRLLAANLPHAGDEAMTESLKKLDRANTGFEAGVNAAKAMLGAVEGIRTTMAGASGWSPVNLKVGRYGANYMARAIVARVGLGANPPEDAVYLNCYKDPTGKALDGANAYRMHFDKGSLPPVEAFWSITVYDAEGYFVANPIGRYAIGDRDKLQFNPDGSLDLYIRSDAPADEAQKRNWLPAPKSGRFNLSFRLYWPKDAILKGDWVPPPVWKD